jgi:hypothetical protein
MGGGVGSMDMQTTTTSHDIIKLQFASQVIVQKQQM